MNLSNKVKRNLSEGKPSFGVSVWSGSPTIVETLGRHALDFVYIETEHSAYTSFETLAHLIRAANASGITPWVRVYENNPVLIAKTIELGAMGIVVPHISNREDAIRAVEAAHYPPRGFRGACPEVREFGYFPERGTLEENLWARAVEASEEELMVIGLIEDKDVVPHLDDILDTDIDGLYPGGFDISHSLGLSEARGQTLHPAVIEIRDTVIRKCREHGKPAACSLGQILEGGLAPIEAIKRRTKDGLMIYHVTGDINIINTWCNQFVNGLQALL
ncbi:MAG: hypothetical protein HYX92_06660 [Chloroflexi bacterium]|nr:hypothetical protein [Chloroflexota bacterium]